ncbi:Crp/Fnr family transcriptional regulator [Sphingopyxis sp. PET50]|uniref:Crp/Fnr family transcriptional regulator n=1 Tax=Sphingopyxis sp. PET50 TaxID=2976533 RepID=UPI0021AE649A|nr:cyclic nucleotide-binding domain-containing protein [Sphingopyxis sp. PET50]
MAQDAASILAADNWFGALAAPLRGGLLDRAHLHDVRDGAHLYRIGDPPNGLHAVVADQMRLVSYPVAGQELVNMIVRPGRWFGELSVIDGRERPHDAVAAGLGANPDGADGGHRRSHRGDARFVAGVGAAQLRASPARHARGRAGALASGARPAGAVPGRSRGAGGGRLRATQDELARIVGVSRQHVNGLLRLLAGRGFIAVGYSEIAIRDGAGLLALAQDEDRA